jgi:hypothetical protein
MRQDRDGEARWAAERKPGRRAGRCNNCGTMLKQDWIGARTHWARQRAR